MARLLIAYTWILYIPSLLLFVYGITYPRFLLLCTVRFILFSFFSCTVQSILFLLLYTMTGPPVLKTQELGCHVDLVPVLTCLCKRRRRDNA
ncbi:hypothetical protein BDV97DRAFT_111734 [Delphinella strobiligena]|nr:hypothetical protein BDV97DRAFT_111734 [Delphinella strobiligena]